MELSSRSDADILVVAEPIMDNLMEGSTRIDHAQHTRDFSTRMKAIVTPEHLKSVCRRYQAEWGVFTEREVAAIFRRPESVVIIWKQRCSQVEGEKVAEIELIEEDGAIKVGHALVF